MSHDNIAQPGGGSGPPTAADASFIGRLLALVLQGMPLIFGIGFLAPLITQFIERAIPGVAEARWPLLVGLAIGGTWGAFANLKGRWL